MGFFLISMDRIRSLWFAIVCSSFISATFQPTPAIADQYIEAIRVTCSPEMQIFIIESEIINETPSYFLRNRAQKKMSDAASWAALKKYGYLPNHKFDFVCKLQQATYRVWGSTPIHQDRGECGGDPRTTLNLSRDGKVVLNKVYFSGSCFNQVTAYLDRLEVHGGIAGWDTETITAQLYDNLGRKVEWWGINRSVDQALMDCIVKNPNFQKSGRDYEARRACHEL